MNSNGIKMQSRTTGNGSFSMDDVRQYQLEISDDTLKTFAFNTHPLAYLDAGLADLPFGDLAKIARQPSIQEWGDLRTWKQAAVSGAFVGSEKIRDAWDEVCDTVTLALRRLMAK